MRREPCDVMDQLGDKISAARIVLEKANAEMRAALHDMALRPEIASTYGVGIHPRDDCLYGVVHALTLDLLGGVGFAAGEIHFFIAPDHWGQGFATEAVGAFCSELARAGVSQAEARLLRENGGSRTVCERTGFRFVHLAQCVASDPVGGNKLLYYKNLTA